MIDAHSLSDKPFVTAIVGCTASGKTALALALAKRYGGEIISCDSMQIYKGMDIGTAKPTKQEQDSVPHHLIDIVDPTAFVDACGYSCADYVRDAREATAEVLMRGRLPILCGGTGLYLDAFLRGGSFEQTEIDPALRAELTEIEQKEGAEALHKMLQEADPESARMIHPNNVKRVIRALEIYRTGGKKKSDLDLASQESVCPYRAKVIGLRWQDREMLYRRIDRRVEEMMDAGLPEETERLRAAGVFARCATAAQAIGYKELFPYLDGEESRADAILRLQIATRHYAKRQMTWFYAKPYVSWIDMVENGKEKPFSSVLTEAEMLFSSLIASDGKDV